MVKVFEKRLGQLSTLKSTSWFELLPPIDDDTHNTQFANASYFPKFPLQLLRHIAMSETGWKRITTIVLHPFSFLGQKLRVIQ